MILWSLGALVLSGAFTSSLIAALPSPKIEKPMETWQDLLKNEFVIKTQKVALEGKIEEAMRFPYLL